MKLIEKTNMEIERYAGFRDAFGKSCELWVNHDLEEVRLRAKNPEYAYRRKNLDSRKLQHVIVPGYLDVIDITPETEREINLAFPEYRHPRWQIWRTEK